MKRLTNANARDLQQAIALAGDARRGGRAVAFAGGGSDLLGMVKDRIIAPDLIVRLATVRNLDQVDAGGGRPDAWRADDARRDRPPCRHPPAICRPGGSGRDRRHAANQKRRDAGRQRLPAAVVLVLPKRVPLLQGRRQPVLLVRRRESVPRDLRRRPELHRPSLGHGARASGARCRVPHRRAWRRASHPGRGVLRPTAPRIRPARTSWPTARCSPRSQLPAPRPGTRSAYHKVMDREAWTHAVVSAAVVLEMDQGVCRTARIVLGGVAPIPWRLPEVEKAARRPAHHARTGGTSRRDRRRRRPSALEERLQGADDQGDRRADYSADSSKSEVGSLKSDALILQTSGSASDVQTAWASPAVGE